MGSEASSSLDRVTILPLRNAVLFPMSVVPINVGRPRSVRVVEDLVGQDRALVGVVAQKSPETIEPTFDDLHSIGTLARVVKVIRRMPEVLKVTRTIASHGRASRADD
jgi:ATP-dependent Lon protease